MIRGPNSSGRSDARIMTAHPAWQLPMTQGLPSALGCRLMTFSMNCASARAMRSMVCPGRFGEKADEIAGVPRSHRNAYLAVSLESTDSRAVTSTGIDYDERPPLDIYLYVVWRNNADQRIVDGFDQFSTIDDQFGSVLQYMRRCLCDVLTILIAALAHDVQEQHTPLPRIDHVFHCRGNKPGHGAARQVWRFRRHVPTSSSRKLIQRASRHATLI